MWFQLDKQQFEETIQTLNNLYAEAEKLGAESYLEGCLACLTAYTIFLCMETHYEKVQRCAVYIASSYIFFSGGLDRYAYQCVSLICVLLSVSLCAGVKEDR